MNKALQLIVLLTIFRGCAQNKKINYRIKLVVLQPAFILVTLTNYKHCFRV